MKLSRQTTLRKRVILEGAGVHSNSPVRLTLDPADAGTGIVFLRTGGDVGDRLIEAKYSSVSATELCTVLGEPLAASVSTVEHLLAALSGLCVDNAVIEIDGPEVPIMDGSARRFVEAIDRAGIVELASSRRYVKVLKPVRVEHGRSFSELRPAAQGCRFNVEIDFPGGVIGRQRFAFDLEPGIFRRDVAGARTFGFLKDVERLWKAGFALGASLDNTIAVDDDRIINPEGLRWADEFVRHKALDAVGDLALAGAPLIGAYRSFCGGHKMNIAVLEALFSDETAFDIVEAPTRRAGRATLGAAAQPAFGPEVS